MRRFTGDTLLLATHNADKLREISAMLAPFDIAVTSVADYGLPEPVESETTFAGNARIKAHAAARATQLPALADDSGLMVDALGGAPGVQTADWAMTPRGRDYAQAMTRTWQALQDAGAPQPWRARFCCTFVLAWPDGADAVFEGAAHGQLVWPPRGTRGHGYDPMFQPDGYAMTFGEMDPALKNRISHRADAFSHLVAMFEDRA